MTAGDYDPERYTLPPHVLSTMDDHWREAMGDGHGIHSYDQLTEELRARLDLKPAS